MKFEVDRKINLVELLTLIVAIIGFLITYRTVTISSEEREEKMVQLALANEIPKLIPYVFNNYTNNYYPETNELKVRVYFRVAAELPIEFDPPKLWLVDSIGNVISNDQYAVLNLQAWKGIWAPGSKYHIEYIIKFNDDFILNGHSVHLEYNTRLANNVKERYADLYEDHEKIDAITNFKALYGEKIYTGKQNEIWDDFWENPR